MQSPSSLRTLGGESLYGLAKQEGSLIPLAEEPSIKEWQHWRIIRNRFPYDLAFSSHDLLLPKRVVADRKDLSRAEASELDWLLVSYIEDSYDMVMVNTLKRQSVPGHYHLHLVSYKPREEFQL